MAVCAGPVVVGRMIDDFGLQAPDLDAEQESTEDDAHSNRADWSMSAVADPPMPPRRKNVGLAQL